MQPEQYDIIITGSGMAGLSLAYRAIKEGVWLNETVLIIDKEHKNKNDKTWCFWQKDNSPSPFEDVVYHSWDNLSCFTNAGKQIRLDNGSYTYKMIRSSDFYKQVLSFLLQSKQVTFFYDNITSVTSIQDEHLVETVTRQFQAKYIFNSIYNKPVLKPEDQYFLQHFKGIRIRTEQFRSNPSEMFLMDFRTTQEHGTTFFYVLPITQNEIFLEYTIFSKRLLENHEYDLKIRRYVTDVLKIENYEVVESEFGAIPMTDYKFKRRTGNIMYIGTIGGDTRASSGYTFMNTQKTISKILTSYRENGHPFFLTENISYKHKLLDATILEVLDINTYQGHEIFSDLFEKVGAETVFTFLNSESGIKDDLKIMSSLKAKHFIGPFMKVLLNQRLQ
jgi:lycopene beta-cyclase